MLGLIADVHVANHKRFGGPITAGINVRCRQVLDTLSAAVDECMKVGCAGLVVLGDLFDTVNPPPQIVREVQRVFDRMPVYLLLGNHDQVSVQPGDHALGPLAPVAEEVVATPCVMDVGKHKCFFVPFRPGPAVEWLPEVVQASAKEGMDLEGACMLLHLGLSDENTPPFLKGAHDSIPAATVAELCRDHGMVAAFSGNWHHHMVHSKKPLVVQAGTLAPTGFDNPGLKHGQLLLWDGKTMQVQQIPGPRFIKMDADDDLELPENGCKYYVQIRASREDLLGANDDLRQAVEDGLVCTGEVVPDTAEIRVAARKAATVARSAETLDEALEGFITEMPLDPGVERQEVAARVRSYLKVKS